MVTLEKTSLRGALTKNMVSLGLVRRCVKRDISVGRGEGKKN